MGYPVGPGVLVGVRERAGLAPVGVGGRGGGSTVVVRHPRWGKNRASGQTLPLTVRFSGKFAIRSCRPVAPVAGRDGRLRRRGECVGVSLRGREWGREWREQAGGGGRRGCLWQVRQHRYSSTFYVIQ